MNFGAVFHGKGVSTRGGCSEMCPPGGGVPRNFPLPSALRINLQGVGLHVHDAYVLSS